MKSDIPYDEFLRRVAAIYNKRIIEMTPHDLEQIANPQAAERRTQAALAGRRISSGDPDSVAKITDRLRALERQHGMMKLANRFLKFGNDAGLLAAGWNPDQIAKMKQPALSGEVGFPAYMLSNSNANMTRLRKRLASLTKPNSAIYAAKQVLETVQA